MTRYNGVRIKAGFDDCGRKVGRAKKEAINAATNTVTPTLGKDGVVSRTCHKKYGGFCKQGLVIGVGVGSTFLYNSPNDVESEEDTEQGRKSGRRCGSKMDCIPTFEQFLFSTFCAFGIIYMYHLIFLN